MDETEKISKGMEKTKRRRGRSGQMKMEIDGVHNCVCLCKSSVLCRCACLREWKSEFRLMCSCCNRPLRLQQPTTAAAASRYIAFVVHFRIMLRSLSLHFTHFALSLSSSPVSFILSLFRVCVITALCLFVGIKTYNDCCVSIGLCHRLRLRRCHCHRARLTSIGVDK